MRTRCTNPDVQGWHGEPWNDSASDRTVIAVERDTDTESYQWCWRVSREGRESEGRATTQPKALAAAVGAAL